MGGAAKPQIYAEMLAWELEAGSCTARDPTATLLPGQGSFCNWESLGISVSCSEFRADPANACPGMP